MNKYMMKFTCLIITFSLIQLPINSWACTSISAPWVKEKYMKDYDKNEDGFLNMDEYTAIINLEKDRYKENVSAQELFKVLDLNGDKQLSIDEFNHKYGRPSTRC